MLTLTWCRLLVLYDTAAPDITGQALHIYTSMNLSSSSLPMKWRGFFFSFFTETPDSRREKCWADSNLILFLFFPFYSSNRQLLSLFSSLSNQWPQSSTFCLVLPAAASELPTCVDLFIYLSQNFLVFLNFVFFFSFQVHWLCYRAKDANTDTYSPCRKFPGNDRLLILLHLIGAAGI